MTFPVWNPEDRPLRSRRPGWPEHSFILLFRLPKRLRTFRMFADQPYGILLLSIKGILYSRFTYEKNHFPQLDAPDGFFRGNFIVRMPDAKNSNDRSGAGREAKRRHTSRASGKYNDGKHSARGGGAGEYDIASQGR